MTSLLDSIDQEFGQTFRPKAAPESEQSKNDTQPSPPKPTPQKRPIPEENQTERRRNPLALDQSAEEITLANIETYLRQWHQLTEMLYEHFNTKTVVILTSTISDITNEDLNRDRFLLQKT
jgi:hypothetical protein